MKRITKYILFLALFSNVCMTQNAFYDALRLDGVEITELKKILDELSYVNLLKKLEIIKEKSDKKIKPLKDEIEKKMNAINDDKESEDIRKNASDFIKTKEAEIKEMAKKTEDNIKSVKFNFVYFTDTERGKVQRIYDFIDKPFNAKNSIKDLDVKEILDMINEKVKDYNAGIEKIKDYIDDPIKIKENKKDKAIIEKIYQNSAFLKENTVTELKTVSSDTKSTSSSYGLETRIIDASSQFIAERIKDDAVLLLIREFKKNIFEYTTWEETFKLFFPNTVDLLETKELSEITINYNSYIQNLKSAFINDLKRLPFNFRTYVNKNNTTGLANELYKNELYPFINIAIYSVDKLLNKAHPSEVLELADLEFYKEIYTSDTKYKNLVQTIHIVNVIQKNVVSLSEESVNPSFWLNYLSLNELKSLNSKKYFIALMFNDEKDDLFNSINTYFSNDNNDFEKKYKNFIGLLSECITALKQMDDQIKSMNASKDKANPEEYINLINNLLSTTEIGFKIAKETKVIDDSITLDKYINNTRNVTEKIEKIYSAIIATDYRNMLVGITGLISLLDDKNINENKLSNRFFPSEVIKSINIIVNVASAKDTKEIKDVLYSIAEPPGSFLRKRESDFSISIGSYPGLSFAIETIDKLDNKPKFNFGITAPLGFNFAFLNNWGFFIQIFDIGAVVNYRFSDTSESLPSEIKLSQVFSPGVNLNYSLSEYPLTFTFGVAMTPQLRKVSSDGLELNDKKSYRFALNLCYDLPILFLYSNAK